MKTHSIVFGAAVALMTAGHALAAGADYAVALGNSPVSLNEGSTSTRVLQVILPLNVTRTGAATLQFEVRDVDFTRNEVYINPIGNLCTGDSPNEDVNQPKSIGYLDVSPNRTAYPTAGLGLSFKVDTIVFPASLLKTGANVIMFCSRTAFGGGGGSIANNDFFAIKNVVLQHKLN